MRPAQRLDQPRRLRDAVLPALLKSAMERAAAAGHVPDSFASVIEVLAAGKNG